MRMSGDRPLKTAVVTGAARGIGRAVAIRLAERGFALALADRLVDQLKETASEISSRGAECHLLPGNVADFPAVQKQGAEVLALWGRVDVLVNNAGIAQPKALLEISEAEWDLTIAVNLKGYFNWCKALAASMVENGGGRIVNISSVSANTGAGPHATSKFAYCAAKAGVLGLTRALARELAPKVIVNAVCPGITETDLTKQRIATSREKMMQQVPLGRLGTPEDIAEVVVFLATASPMFVNGEVIDVDGGQYIN